MSLVLIAFAWFVLWLMLGAAFTARKEGDAWARATGALLPAFAAMTCLGYFFLTPVRMPMSHSVVLWVHHASILALWVFLLSTQFLQAESWWKRRSSRPIASIAATYYRLWILTELCPGAIAVTIFLTGLRLLWETPGANSPSQVWLMVIIIVFGLAFVDGLAGFTPIVRRWRTYWATASTDGDLNQSGGPPRFAESLQIFLHFISWPVLFVLALFRYDVPNPLSALLGAIERGLGFLPDGWPAVVLAVVIWACAGAAVLAVRAVPRGASAGGKP